MTNKVNILNLVLSVLTLVLALPLGIVGTLLAPKIANWWARTNTSTLSRRIRRLRLTLERVEQNRMLSESENQVLLAAEQIIELLIVLLASFLIIGSHITVFAPWNSAFIRVVPESPPWKLSMLVYGVILAFVFVTYWAFLRPLQTWRTERTEEYRKELLKELGELTHDLAERTIPSANS